MALAHNQTPVTKNELRSELESTKQELRSEIEATKEELLTKLAGKKEVETVANQVANNHQEIVALKSDVRDLKKNVTRILETVDGIAKKFDDTQTEKAAIDHAIRRHEKRFEDHEKRITALESS